MLDLTQEQTEYINNLMDNWNRCMSEKPPQEFVKDDLSMAIVTATAAIVSEKLEGIDGGGAATWGLVLLGAFMYKEGLLTISEGTLQ
jgi:hypothetical protein